MSDERCAHCGWAIRWNPEFKTWIHVLTDGNQRFDHDATKAETP